MKKIYLLLISMFMISASSFAQGMLGGDCCDAIQIPGTSPWVMPGLNISPHEDDVSCSCLDSEGFGAWLMFDCYESGSFEMMITGIEKENWDFALWQGRCPCGQGSSLVACNDDAPADPVLGPFVPTGIAKDPMQSFGVPGLTEFVTPAVTLFEGQTYFLLATHTSSFYGFEIQFAGDAVIGPHVPPPGPASISGPTSVCPGSTTTYTIPAGPFLQGYTWSIEPPFSNNFTSNQQFYSIDVNWNQVGTYELCVEGIIDGCFKTQQTCITVEVNEIQTFMTDVICLPGEYVAPDGQYIYSPGVYNIVVPSYLGCDSNIVLTLNPALTNFNVRVETICDGDCYNFEGDVVCEPGAYEKVYPNQFGCDSTILLNLIVFPQETKITGVDTLDCNTTSLVLNGSSSVGGPNMTFVWRKGNQVVGTNPTLTVTTGGTYSLTTKSIPSPGDTCESVKTVTIIADFALPANVTATAGALNCNTSTTTLMGNSTTSGVTYSWTGPGGYTSNLQNPTVTVAGTYTLTVTGLNGCKKTATVTVVSNPPPTATATGGTINCNNPSVQIFGNSSVQAVTYSWAGPNGVIILEQNPIVNVAGNYVLTITDAAGCTSSATAVVHDGTAAPNASAAANGSLNCQASSVVLSGAGSSTGASFSYMWTTQNGNIVSGANTLTPTVNEPGTYSILVTNTGTGCTNTASTTVTETPQVSGSIASQTNVLCFGDDTGSATASGGGGNGVFSYNWSNGATGATNSNLGAGNYSVTITDGEGCTATASVTISQPTLLEANASATGQIVIGANDGTATADPNGGVSPYSYEWSNGQTTQTIVDLAPGVYTVTVTDNNGCESIQSVNVPESNCNLKANVEKENVSCAGANDGFASITLDNAEPPINYVWSNGETTQSISDLDGGNYTVTATDENGCEVVVSILILEPSTLNANATADDETAPGANDGTATANPTGGTAPYEYLWNTGQSTQTIIFLPPGEYTVVVTDTFGCQATQTVEVETAGCAIQANVSGTDISCNGAADGQATATPVGGFAPFTYLWSNDDTEATTTDLSAGTYTVTITDDIGCPAVAEVTIGEPDELIGSVDNMTMADCMATNGSATVSATGGTPDYVFNWSNSATGETVGNLAPGDYTVSIIDANGCETTVSLTIIVNDIDAPTVATQDITLELGQDGTVSISPDAIDNGSTDDCQIVSMTLDVSSFSCDDIGENEVALTVTDAAGNVSTETAVVTVVDNMPPNLVLQNITVSLDANGVATVTPAMFDDGSADNCGDIQWTIEPTTFDCDNLGDNDVELTATDDGGNTITMTVTATVVDETEPTISCPEGLFLAYCDPVGVFTVTADDNCASAVGLTQTAGLPSGSNFPVGNTTITYEAEDANGNTATCSFMITVPSAMGLAVNGEDLTCFNENDGSAAATVNGGTPPYTYEWSSGQTTASINNLEPGEYTVTVTDAEGCDEVQTVTIDEPAEIDVTLVSIQNAIVGQSNGSIDVSITGGVPPLTYSWTDINGNVLATTEDISNLPAGTYQLQVTDANDCQTPLSAYTIQETNSTAEPGFDSRIGLFPNPTTGEVFIELKDIAFNEMEVAMYDVVGKNIGTYSSTNGANKHRLDFSQQPSGVYLLKIRIGEKVATKRLVVSK